MNYAVIMAGGSGSRFWPLSREEKPKQCLPIHSEKPMIVETIDRLEPLFGKDVLISTNEKLAEQFKKILPDTESIVEPMRRNTAACIGLSAVTLLAKDPDAVMFLETADHIYEKPEEYLANVKVALDTATNENKIVLLGISPSHPHTGYGYIEKGGMFTDGEIKVFNVKSFQEKPNLETAQSFFESGNFLWNSGMFISKCSVMLDEIKTHIPNMHEGLMKIKDSNFDSNVIRDEFEKFESISIDYGVMEKSSCTLVLDAKIHWDDVGDFEAYDRFIEKKDDNTIVNSDYVGIDSKNNIICTDSGKNVSLIGIDDLIIVDTKDALLIAKKGRAQDVKKIIDELKKKGKEELL